MKNFIKTISVIILTASFFLAVYAVNSEQEQRISQYVDIMKRIAVEVDILKGNQNNFVNQEDVVLGGDSTQFVGGGVYKLANSISSTDTSITLQSFTIPVSEYELSMSDFGDIGYITLDPGTSKREFISFTGVSQDSGSTKATLTGVTRGLSFVAPYTASTTLRLAHSGGSRAIISNPPQLYNRIAVKDNDETITGLWEFDTVLPISSIVATSSTQFANKQYVDNVSYQGTATATDSVAGIVELATALEAGSSTPSTATNPYVLQAEYATSSPTASCTTLTTCVVMSIGNKISQAWIDLTEAFTFTGKVTLNHATTTLNTVDYSFPSTEGASSTALLTDGNGMLSWNTVPSDIELKGNYGTTTIVNTTSLTTILTETITANSVGANGKIKARIYISDLDIQAGGQLITYTTKFGGTTVFSFSIGNGGTIAPTLAMTNGRGYIEVEISNDNDTGTQVISGVVHFYNGTGTTYFYENTTYSAIDTTANATLLMEAQWNNAEVANNSVTKNANVEVLTSN